MAEINEIRAFRRGLDVMDNTRIELRKGLMNILGINTRTGLAAYAAGKMPLDVVKAQKIEELFKQFGIHNPWGFTPKQQ